MLFLCFNPLSANPIKWSNSIKQFFVNFPTNCLSVFDHFVKSALKELIIIFTENVSRFTAGAKLPPVCTSIWIHLLVNQTRTNMSENTRGPSNAVRLVPNPKPLKLELCLICQNVKDSAGSSKLTNTEAGRKTIISTSRKLEDDLVTNIDQNRIVDIRYHVKSCYATYKKKGARHEAETTKRKPEEPDLSPLLSLVTRPKRSKTITFLDPRDKLICNHVKCQGDKKKDFGLSPQR